MNQRSLLLSLVIALGVPALAWSQTTEPPAPVLLTSRPAPLIPLYVGFASAQALDIHSTSLAIDRGARERNPLLKVLGADTTWAAVAVKASITGATIWTAEHMWKRNRRMSAVVLMVAVTAFQTAVDAHNYRVAARLR
jgi:hypothetical protein